MSLGLYLDYGKEVHPLLIARWSQGFISGQGQTIRWERPAPQNPMSSPVTQGEEDEQTKPG